MGASATRGRRVGSLDEFATAARIVVLEREQVARAGHGLWMFASPMSPHPLRNWHSVTIATAGPRTCVPRRTGARARLYTVAIDEQHRHLSREGDAPGVLHRSRSRAALAREARQAAKAPFRVTSARRRLAGYGSSEAQRCAGVRGGAASNGTLGEAKRIELKRCGRRSGALRQAQIGGRWALPRLVLLQRGNQGIPRNAAQLRRDRVMATTPPRAHRAKRSSTPREPRAVSTCRCVSETARPGRGR